MSMKKLVNPHGGGDLKPLLLEGAALFEAKKAAESLPKLQITSRESGDILMMGCGAFTPLEGFMGYNDWKGVCDEFKMANGLFWPIPITLSTDDENVKEGDSVALVDPDSGELMASIKITEKYEIDKTHECKSVFTMDDMDHPGVQKVMAQGKYNLAGPIKVFTEGGFPETYGDIYATPAETRKIFEANGWKRVAAL